MRIHPFVTTTTKDSVSRAARIEFSSVTKKNYPWYSPPSELCYKLPITYHSALADNAHSFLIPMVSVAMFFQEDIHVHGKVSHTLLQNLAEYQHVLNYWRPDWFSLISITADSYVDSEIYDTKRGTLGTYSGGVDSTFTLWSHLPEQEPLASQQITHVMYIRGFDTVEDTRTQDIKLNAFAPFISKLNIQFMDTSSNAMQFHAFDEWTKLYMTFSAVLVGSMVQFEPIISQYYFSADNTHDFPMLSSINHHLVPLLSTGNMKMIVHGASVTKLEKIKCIAGWDAIHDKLVVCHENPNGLTNCGSCLKCCLISSTMRCAGVLDRFTTFPNRINYHGIRTNLHHKAFLAFPKSVASFAKEHKERRIQYNYMYVTYASLLYHYGRYVVSGIAFIIHPIRHPLKTAYAASGILKKYSTTYELSVQKSKHFLRTIYSRIS